MSWVPVTLRNGWSAGDAQYGVPEYSYENAVVSFRGSVAPGGASGQTAFVIPSWYGPTIITEWAALGLGPGGGSIQANLSVRPTGEVRVFYRGGTPTHGIALNGSYRLD